MGSLDFMLTLILTIMHTSLAGLADASIATFI